jgi:hypothetical protein
VGCGPEQQSKWGIANARQELGRSSGVGFMGEVGEWRG